MKKHRILAWVLAAAVASSTIPTAALALSSDQDAQLETAVVAAEDDTAEGSESDETAQPDRLDLTDLDWLSAKVSYGQAHRDLNVSGSAIRLLVDGTVQSFDRGVGAHASSTVIYDISDYDYDTFSVYTGVDYGQGGRGSVKFYVYTSQDGSTWELATSQDPDTLTSSSNAQRLVLDIAGAKYLKLYADSDGGNGNDHAVWAAPVLYNAVALDAQYEHGTVTLSDAAPIPGDTVTVRTAAEPGYLLMSLYVLTASGAVTDITETSSFTMPAEDATVVALFQEGQLDRLSLLDMDYDATLSSGHMKPNQSHDNVPIQLYVDGEVTLFETGMGAHANTTIVYDLAGYDYSWFESYAGVHYTKANLGNGVKFYVYTSQDGSTWEQVASTGVLMGQDDAAFIRAYIKNARYLKLVTDKNGSDSYDHACWGDPVLVAADSSGVDFTVPTVAEYDEQIKAQYPDVDQALIHRRDFVSAVGSAALNNFIRQSEDNLNAIQWLMTDEQAMAYYMLGGSPEGTYYNSLVQLSRLYAAYADDMDNDLYLRMVIALALSHATATGLWASSSDPANISDPVDRYAIYKKMYLAGKLNTAIFEDNNIEEMRWVMNSIIDDESIEWLRDWTYAKKEAGVSGYMNPYTYVSYKTYNYGLSQYHDEEYYDQWNEKYHLSDYGITYGPTKTWIVFEQGGVCGAISKTGTTIQNVYGIPASCVGQPSHCAYIYQTMNADGDRIWNLGNNVSGWAYTGVTERLNIRMICDWGTRPDFSWQHPMTYVFLAQEALNDWDSYAQAETILMLADVYADDQAMVEQVYEQALQAEGINYDAWYGLVKLYIAQGRSDSELAALASRIAAAYQFHPMPMNDLLTLLTNAMTDGDSKAATDILRINTLTAATKATSADSLQYGGVQAEANRLLNQSAGTVVTFSFDGDDANVLMLGDKYDGTEVAWEYMIDGQNWVTAPASQVALDPDQVTPENGIKVHIIGTDYADSSIYTITVTQAAAPSGYKNNWEGKLMGDMTNVEYRLDGDADWQDYEDGQTFGISKTETVTFRVKASGTQKASPERTETFYAHDFTAGTYLSIDHMSADPWPVGDGKCNSYATFKTEAVLTLDDVYNVSGGWYVADQSNNYGRVKSLSAYTSLDGENWTLVMDSRLLPDTNEPQQFRFDLTTQAKYVKYVANSVYSGAARAEMFMVAYEEPIQAEELTLTSDNLDLVGYTAGDTVLDIPELILGSTNYQVTAIEAGTFMLSDLKTVTLPSTVRTIGGSAFMYCDQLETVTLPDGLTEIADYLFFEDDQLTTVTIPASVTAIGDSAFHMCASLTDIYFGGTQAQWDAIAVGSYNDALRAATVHCTGDGASAATAG